MLFVYPAIFHKEDESYWVEFPDLKGCNTYGSTIPEAMEMAQEALTGYLLSLLEHGDHIASPSDILPFMRLTVFPPLCRVTLTSIRTQRQ